MPFPEWGQSYNALYVPLKSGWQCALVPARDIQDVDRGWRLSYEDRQKARMERDEQMEKDRRDFDQLFRVSISRSASRISGDYSAYAGFIREHVRGGWHTPIDGGDITRILREAVRDGLIVPAIDRNYRGSKGISKRYAAQAWPKRAPDPKTTIYASRNGQFYPMDLYGNIMDEHYYAPLVAKPAASASNADRSGIGFDWLGAVEAAGGALDGAMFGGEEDNNYSGMMLKSFGNSDSSGSLLGDTKPFEYEPDSLNGDSFDIAARGVKLTGNEPGGFSLNPNGIDTDYFDSNGNLTAQYHESHGEAHGHNFYNGVRDPAHLPMSPIPRR